MTTDDLGLKPRVNVVFRDGTTVCITHTIPSEQIEEWVQKVASKSGQPVDWQFVGDQAVVKALGDLAKVREAIRELTPEHDELFRRETDGMCGPPPLLLVPTR
jgi:hypothetical protein